MTTFNIKDCALIALSTGTNAQTLSEFSAKLSEIESSSIYYHFWATLLCPQFDNPEFSNDFAAWAYNALHDQVLAERLNAVDPSRFSDIGGLRNYLVDIINDRLDESETLLYAKNHQKFFFIKSHIVVFDTQKECRSLQELMYALPSLSLGSIFYHFIDARRRTEQNRDDFSKWLQDNGTSEKIIKQIHSIDPYFSSLSDTKKRLTETLLLAQKEAEDAR